MLTPREIEEYRALRATIRERGTARVWIVLGGIGGWGALALATAAVMPLPVASILPLTFLATAFEIVFALHTAVERIGRYLQVFFEDDAGWEHAAMAFGPTPFAGVDPLFANYFRIATILNFVPVAFARPMPIEWGFVGIIHVMFVVRVAVARRQAARQRPADLERFQQIKSAASAPRI